MKEKWKEILEQLHRKRMKGKVPKHILEAFCHVIKTEYKGKKDYIRRSYAAEIKEVIRQQQMIGIDLMLRGFLEKGWM